KPGWVGAEPLVMATWGGTAGIMVPGLWCRHHGDCRIRPCWGRSRSMELGIYHEFPVLPGRSQAECFAAAFVIVDASEEYGLDVMWIAELHFDKRRALAASPLVLGTAVAARTERIRIGTSVQVLPLANPLRIAEESAILDHVSKGRLIFG